MTLKSRRCIYQERGCLFQLIHWKTEEQGCKRHTFCPFFKGKLEALLEDQKEQWIVGIVDGDFEE
jgi:hypothetical protein